MKVIGITGGVGCGKSAVLGYLENNYDCYIVETDKLAHKLQEKGNRCYDELVSCFGREILDKDGIIDRNKLGKIVFSDNEKRELINNIVHPGVTEELKKLSADLKDKEGLFVIESALLFEAGIDKICHKTMYIYTNQQLRRERLKKSRGYTDEKITDIINSQQSERFFLENCDCIIDNNDSLEHTFKQIREELM